ncbi:uncharacterized protein LOC139922918 [Centroberyx gerrardi]|uniref:uncharacterized protein n=1 Tax=Centroberyx gerrardi TaxID=166262 RepID=UPI003AACE309
MNLYRSFGNLLETWVTEGVPCSDPEQDKWLGGDCGNSLTAPPDMGPNLRSESVDSGVEMASSDTSLPSPHCSVSMGNTEIDTVTTEREEDRLTPASTLQSSVLSAPSSAPSSSLYLCPRTAQTPQEGSMALHLKVERALQRTEPRCQSLRNNPESHTDDVVLRRRTHSSLAKQRASTLVKGQRPESFGMRKTVSSSVPSRQMSEPCRRPLSLYHDNLPAQTKTEDRCEEEREVLSPGLSYLEQVCRMLEEIARLQMRNRGLQTEMDALREHQAKQANQAPETLLCDCKAVAEDVSSCQRLEIAGVEHISSGTQWLNHHAYRDFRQRSASDTRILAGHLRKLKPDSRGQHRSKDDLLEQATEDHETQEFKKEEVNKTKTWKLKVASLRREESTLKPDSEISGQQMHQKNSSRRRLSQLFRRRRKTLPA